MAPSSSLGVDLEPGPVPLDHQVVDAGQPAETGRRRGQLGGDRRTGQVAEVGEGARLDGAPGPDDADPVAELLDLGQDVTAQEDGTAPRRKSSMHSWKTASISGSSPEVGSSSTSSSTSAASAATRATFCRFPFE